MNLEILYEDAFFLVCIKPPKVPSQKDPTGDLDMLTLVRDHIKAMHPKAQNPYVGLIHRLDRPVGGVMIFGKTKEATAHLSKQMQMHSFQKKYYTVVCGKPENDNGQLEHYLFRVASKNISKVVESTKSGSKKAILDYQLIESIEHPEYGTLSLMDVSLQTGRHHQIRVQWSYEGMPIWGDTKYNPVFLQDGKWFQIALWSYEISIVHPKTKKSMTFKAMPINEEPFKWFSK